MRTGARTRRALGVWRNPTHRHAPGRRSRLQRPPPATRPSTWLLAHHQISPPTPHRQVGPFTPVVPTCQ